MKVFKRIFCWLALIGCCIGVIKLRPKAESSGNKEVKNTIITLWHIDTFEGGIGSRQDFLSKASVRFEKRYDGIFVCVIGYTVEEAQENMNKGIYPDMISYGIGFDNYRNMREIRAKSKYFCTSGGKKAAVGWCRGGYVLLSHGSEESGDNASGDYIGGETTDYYMNNAETIYNTGGIAGGGIIDGKTNFKTGGDNIGGKGQANAKTADNSPDKDEEIIISKGKYNNPEIALALSGTDVKNYDIKSPTEAYSYFLKNKNAKLLGTQRDIWRLENRQVPFKIEKVCSFSDLVQYISVYTSDENKNFYSQKFIEYLLSEDSQKRLTQIGMLTVNDKSIYSKDDAVNVLENSDINGGLYVFTDREKIEKLQSEAARILSGDNKNLSKLRDYLQWK